MKERIPCAHHTVASPQPTDDPTMGFFDTVVSRVGGDGFWFEGLTVVSGGVVTCAKGNKKRGRKHASSPPGAVSDGVTRFNTATKVSHANDLVMIPSLCSWEQMVKWIVLRNLVLEDAGTQCSDRM
ncbi:uncharacterized protein [Glycine max]|uniref:uncharacterized protein n=1 Tax=Glycine max TaxID=3847 RepID=UPI0007192415|nr:uncharacterized protein LOC106797051 [Glycine max]|eukprot:XP_014626235.1 uncharacterized protein LOC106797051 [Glycine max]